MTVLKWMLATLAVVFAGVVVVVAGIAWWAGSVEAVQITEADLAPGGVYTQADREAFLKACEKSKSPQLPNCCPCMAENGAKLSRYSRLLLVAGYEGMDATRMVAMTKGLMQSGIPEEKIEAASKNMEQEAEAVKKACGWIP